MSGVPSLEASIRTCQVDTAWANRAQSDRFLNTNALMCPTFKFQDPAGRPICVDSWNTKSPGCNSPLDRVVVENALRPQYSDYITLNPQGIQGNMYGCGKSSVQRQAAMMGSLKNVTGDFGQDMGSNVSVGCSMMPYEAAQAQARRGSQYGRQGMVSNGYRQMAGGM